MKAPLCKLCETRHWLYEVHEASVLEKVRELGAGVLRNSVAKPSNVTPVTKPVLSDGAEGGVGQIILGGHPTDRARDVSAPVAHSSAPSPSAGGRPKKHKTNAERQRAYRERHGS